MNVLHPSVLDVMLKSLKYEAEELYIPVNP